jgi:hypothetical protein
MHLPTSAATPVTRRTTASEHLAPRLSTWSCFLRYTSTGQGGQGTHLKRVDSDLVQRDRAAISRRSRRCAVLELLSSADRSGRLHQAFCGGADTYNTPPHSFQHPLWILYSKKSYYTVSNRVPALGANNNAYGLRAYLDSASTATHQAWPWCIHAPPRLLITASLAIADAMPSLQQAFRCFLPEYCWHVIPDFHQVVNGRGMVTRTGSVHGYTGVVAPGTKHPTQIHSLAFFGGPFYFLSYFTASVRFPLTDPCQSLTIHGYPRFTFQRHEACSWYRHMIPI